MRTRALRFMLAVLLCCLGSLAAADASVIRNIRLTHRHLFGPGPLPDQELARGYVHGMQFTSFMRATVPGINNGGAPPNVSGEALQGTPVDGALSDGTLINENIDMGHALLLQGRFNLLLAAVHGGPHHGNSEFFLDDKLNWTIQDDIAIDPGFAEGLIKIHDFRFTSGPTFVPFSLQTQRKHPGGVDLVGSLRSGEVIIGRVGDDDLDGHVDGVWMALGTFPFDSILLPGAPFVQSIEFESDIPIDPMDAAMLSLAAARNMLKFLQEQNIEAPAEVAKLVDTGRQRVQIASKHLQRAMEGGGCLAECKRAGPLRERLLALEILDGAAAIKAIPELDAFVAELETVHEAAHGKLKTGL